MLYNTRYVMLYNTLNVVIYQMIFICYITDVMLYNTYVVI